MVRKTRISVVTAISVLVMCLVFGLLVSVTLVHREEPRLIQEKVNAFLTDVIGLNLTENRIVQRYYSPYSNIILQDLFSLAASGGIYKRGTDVNIGECIQKQVSCTLQSPAGKMYIVLYLNAETQMVDCYTQRFENDSFFSGSPAPANSSYDILNLTKRFLERYENYVGSPSYILEMRKTLDTIDIIEPLNMTLGNIKLRISDFDRRYVTITLLYTSEGIDYDSKEVRLAFLDEVLYYFVDTWNLK